jgi:predicted DNA-binding transcriptional regulator YafY
VAGGYRLGAGGELPPLLLDDAEAVAVAVGLRTAATGSISGIEDTSVQALAKLEQVLPTRLRRRIKALSATTSAFGVEGPRIDADLLATLASAYREGSRLRFTYEARNERTSRRHAEPSAVVHSGYRWYLVAFDLDRDDWRTFRIDRIRGRVQVAERGRHRTVPGGDPAAFVEQRLRSPFTDEPVAPPGRIRIRAGAELIRKRVPSRYISVEPDGEDGCIVATRGAWSRHFLAWMALLEESIEILGPPEMIAAASTLANRLTAAAAGAAE